MYLEDYSNYIKKCNNILKNDESVEAKLLSEGQKLSKTIADKILFFKNLLGHRQVSDLVYENSDSIQCEMGIMYYHGIGVDQSYEDSLKFFKKAANLGNVDASLYLGIFYYYGNGGVKQSFEKAFELFKQAADNGNSIAQYYIGIMYKYGIGTTKSLTEAFGWFEKSAHQGNSLSQLNLGLMYESGQVIGGHRCLPNAIEWLEKSAIQDNEFAKVCLKKLRK